MGQSNKHLVSTVILSKEQITTFFYNYCKVMGLPLFVLGYILDVPLKKIIKGTKWEFEASQGDVYVTLGPKVHPIKNWNVNMAEYLSSMTLEKDPHGEGFAAATHLFIKEYKDTKNMKIIMSVIFTETGARLKLLLETE